MLERIKRTQDAGYALNDVSAVSGFRAIGIAVRDAAANPVAAISISAISDRIAGKRKDELVALLKSEALGVEKLLRQPSTARRA
jgi:DNA-binding IclR family transcriptional regulator